LPEADGAAGGIDVIQPQVADLTAGSAVQQGEDAEQSLVRVEAGSVSRAGVIPRLIPGTPVLRVVA
jgi:hypothetical protein